MDQRQEFRSYIRAVKGEFHNSLGRHLSEDELIEYHQGQLDETEQEKVQSHLVQCHECLEVFKDISGFFQAAPEGGETFSEAELDQKWEACWQRAQIEGQPTSRALDLRPTGFWSDPRATLALAASLILAIGLTSMWTVWQWREKQQLVGQWQLQEKNWAERLKALEQENRQLQEQARALQQYESQLAQLRQPTVNAPIYDLLPRGAIPRSDAETEVNRVKVPATARNVVMILHRNDNQRYSGYEMEILDQHGQLRWRGKGLEPTGEGSFVMTLDRTFLSQGEYHWRLYGQQGGRSRKIAEYVIWVE